MSKRILVITVSADLHARAVCWALRQLGGSVDQWVATDFPERQTISLWLGETREDLCIEDCAGEIRARDFDTVWLRRFWKSRIPDQLHAEDRAPAGKQIDAFRKAILHLTGRDAFWVNSPDVLYSSGEKPAQLSLARRAGLRVPDTLISNDPDAVREFFSACGGQVIYKPLEPMVWRNDRSRRVTYTTALSGDDLENDASIRLCPGIFQRNEPKAYEVRATFMGATCLAVRLDAQGVEEVEQDWRVGVARGISLRPVGIRLPEAVYRRCRTMMRELGIVSGAFDFIVTPEDDFIFLEVNPGGQFLWVEMENGEFPMLEVFARFLISGDSGFSWSGTPDPTVSMAAWQDSEDYARYEDDPNDGHQPYPLK